MVIAGIVWLTVMLINILLPSGTTSPRGEFFNYDWMTILVVAVIVLIGAVYTLVARPARRIRRTQVGSGLPAPEVAGP